MGATDFDAMGGWPGVLSELAAGRHLSAGQAAAALGEVLAGDATSAQIAAFVFGLRCKGETVEEMRGLVAAMLAAAERVQVGPELADRLVDTCGTGGDRSGTINVSTIAALVVAGAGVPVCKHGGRAASSKAGSADVLEALGVAIEVPPDGVRHCIETAGIGFCFAPRYHPAMRHAVPTRRELGVPTAFNLLGPLANPARVRRQVVGVGDPAAATRMCEVLVAGGARSVMVVHGDDGLDELTTTTTSTVVAWAAGDDAPRVATVDPADLGLAPAAPGDLVGGDAATNAALARAVLEGAPGAHRDIVVLNAAAALVVAGVADGMAAGLEAAAASVDSGAAATALERLVAASRQAAC
ncbi:MAG TPA: anthranilate phosphoribosyltransferase [Acidimicrobiales bacterium]|nr:anthranilate phosphoribosyltransferase [Acidimicrobiales bacterium]